MIVPVNKNFISVLKVTLGIIQWSLSNRNIFLWKNVSWLENRFISYKDNLTPSVGQANYAIVPFLNLVLCLACRVKAGLFALIEVWPLGAISRTEIQPPFSIENLSMNLSINSILKLFVTASFLQEKPLKRSWWFPWEPALLHSSECVLRERYCGERHLCKKIVTRGENKIHKIHNGPDTVTDCNNYFSGFMMKQLQTCLLSPLVSTCM